MPYSQFVRYHELAQMTMKYGMALTLPLTQQLTAIFGFEGSVARPVLSRPLNVPVICT